MSRALLTGTAGFIGSHLAEQLIAAGSEVRGVDRFSDYYDPALKRRNLEPLEGAEGFELVEGDLNELDLPALLDGVEVVYHLAGQPGVRQSWGSEFDVYVDDNVRATQALLEAAKDAPLRRFVMASSSSIYGDAGSYPTGEDELPRPVSPYGVTKLAGEHLARLYLKAFEVPAVTLRYFSIFGPRQRPDMAFCRFIEAAREDRPITIFGDGEQVRDYTYVGDCVAATIAAGERGEPGGIYNVAGGSPATVLDVIEILSKVLGREVRREHEPAVPGDARRTGADTEKARAELGYSPAVSLEQGLERQVEAAG